MLLNIDIVTFHFGQHFAFKLYYITLRSYIYSVIQYVHYHSPLTLRRFYSSMPSLLHRLMNPSLMLLLICLLFILPDLPFKTKELFKCRFGMPAMPLSFFALWSLPFLFSLVLHHLLHPPILSANHHPFKLTQCGCTTLPPVCHLFYINPLFHSPSLSLPHHHNRPSCIFHPSP